MKLELTKKAVEDMEFWASADRKRLMKIRNLIREIVATPFTGTGKPEPLRHELSGCLVTQNQLKRPTHLPSGRTGRSHHPLLLKSDN